MRENRDFRSKFKMPLEAFKILRRQMYRANNLNASTGILERKRGMYMLYDNPPVLEYLEKEKGKIIHLYGDPDTGRTSVMFSMIDYLIRQGQPCAYLVPSSGSIQAERFKHYIKDLSMCPLVIIKDRKSLSFSLKCLTEATENIFIDCFLSFILYRSKRQNVSLMSLLSGYAFGAHTNFILCNDTRHIPGEERSSPAYMEIFRRYSSKNVLVYKDAATNIYYNFKEW